MAKLHELLAAEKTPTATWNAQYEDVMKKFSNPDHFFEGHTRTLRMLEDSPENAAVEAQAAEHKPVVTTVLDTLTYALDLYARAEDVQCSKNCTNQKAVGTVMWDDMPLLPELPVDELLGLEARLARLKELLQKMPTLSATREWKWDDQTNTWITARLENTTKTDKVIVPVTLSPATDKHPAQIQAVTRDKVVGTFTMLRSSGSVTSIEKAQVLQRLDRLTVEVKQARMRANETEVDQRRIGKVICDLLLEPLKSEI